MDTWEPAWVKCHYCFCKLWKTEVLKGGKNNRNLPEGKETTKPKKAKPIRCMSKRYSGDERKVVFLVFLTLISVQQNQWVLHWAPCDKKLSSSLGGGVPLCWLPAWVMHAVSRHSLHPRNKAHSRLDYSYSTAFCFSSCALICKPLNKRHKAVCKIQSRVCCPVKSSGLPKPGFSGHHNVFFKTPSMTKLTTTTTMRGKGGN